MFVMLGESDGAWICLAANGVFLWLASIFVATQAGSEAGRATEGFSLGLLLGPIGMIAALLLPRTAKAQANYDLDVLEWMGKLRKRRGESSHHSDESQAAFEARSRTARHNADRAQAEFDEFMQRERTERAAGKGERQ